MTHALLSASGASRWMNCTPSVRLEEQFPESKSDYAEEGSIAHKLAEIINSYNFRKVIGLKITKAQMRTEIDEIKKSSYYNKEMEDYIDDFCKYVWEAYNAAKAISSDAVIGLEERLDYSNYAPEGFGTGDAVIVADGLLTIIDLKYGQGVKVSSEENKQMMLYALGAIEKYDLEYGINNVKTVIYQPRVDNISEWEITADSLIEWANTELKEKAALAYDAAGEFCPGDHCRFCKAKAVCRARAEENLKLAAYEFRQPELLEDEEIADILRISERLTNWAGDITAYALDQAINNGRIFPGWKVVEGRSNRVITKPAEAAGILIEKLEYRDEDIYNTKLKGIGDLEKLLGKEIFNMYLSDYVVKPQGKPTLAPETDKRPAINSAVAAAKEFEGIDIE